jgi:Ankyrin repeats (3 copies)
MYMRILLIIICLVLGFTVNAQSKKELKEIIKTEDTLTLKSFMNKGFDLNSNYNKNTSFLNEAILREKINMTSFILNQENVQMQRIEKGNFSTLNLLVSKGWYSLAQKLIDAGVDPNTLGYKNSHILRTVLFNYQWKEHSTSLNFIKYLYSKGINPELSISCCPKKTTPLILSVMWSDYPTVEYFISQEKNSINLTDHKNRTALHWAVKRQVPDIVKLLIENGVNPNLKDNKGRTPLDYAIKQSNKIIIDLINTASNN